MIGLIALFAAVARAFTMAGSIVFNEVMYAPAGGEPEWIELKNNTGVEIDLTGWAITDATVSSRHTLSTGGLIIPADGFVVLTKDSAALAQFRPAIPCRVVSVSSFPSLNNTGDALWLYDNDGVIADGLVYEPSWGAAGDGTSLERVDSQGTSQDSLQWSASVDPQHATPGRENSIAIRDFDVRPANVRLETSSGGDVQLVFAVANFGRLSASGISVKVYDDIDGDGSGSAGEELFSTTLEGTMAPLDSIPIRWDWPSPGAGAHAIVVDVIFSTDQRPGNNTGRSELVVPGSPGTILINEILFAPLSGEPEYVELCNPGSNAVNVAGWKVNDRRASDGSGNVTGLPGGSRFIPPGGFAVIASDSGIFRWFPETKLLDLRLIIVPHPKLISLNNDGDDVVLRDAMGNLIDSVSYDPSWHNPSVFDRSGRSLERVLAGGVSNNASNWTTCVRPEGGTPGRGNSVQVSGRADGRALSCSPSPFSPDGDGQNDLTVIRYLLPRGDWSVHARIFDVCGRQVRRLLTDAVGSSQGECVWDGRDDGHLKVRMGIYIVLLEAIDTSEGRSVIVKGVVVVAGRLR